MKLKYVNSVCNYESLESVGGKKGKNDLQKAQVEEDKDEQDVTGM